MRNSKNFVNIWSAMWKIANLTVPSQESMENMV